MGNLDTASDPSAYAPGAKPGNVTGGPFRGGYDRRLNVYNLKPYHLRKTRAALGRAAAGIGVCRIAHAGDSTSEGIGSGSPTLQNTLSWPAQFAALMNAKGYNVDGHGLVGAYTNNAGTWPQWSFSPALGTTGGYAQFGSGIGLGWVIATSTSSIDLPLIDMVDRWKDQPTMNAFNLYFDALHPNPGGYADVARTVITALGL